MTPVQHAFRNISSHISCFTGRLATEEQKRDLLRLVAADVANRQQCREELAKEPAEVYVPYDRRRKAVANG